MQAILDNVTISGIEYTELIEAYGDVDAFSTGKIMVQVDRERRSATNMGKNDLWIAATAKAFDLTLVTTDRDFEFLDGKLIDVLYVDLEDVKKKLE